MRSPSAASTATPAPGKAQDTMAAATASPGPGRHRKNAAASTAAAPRPAAAYVQAGAQASGQATASRPSPTAAPLGSVGRLMTGPVKGDGPGGTGGGSPPCAEEVGGAGRAAACGAGRAGRRVR